MPGDLDFVLEDLVERVAAKVVERIGVSGTTASRRLLTVDRAAEYLGRTSEALYHMIHSGKLSIVRIDRRVCLDVRDLDRLIQDCKLDNPGFGAVHVKP